MFSVATCFVLQPAHNTSSAVRPKVSVRLRNKCPVPFIIRLLCRTGSAPSDARVRPYESSSDSIKGAGDLYLLVMTGACRRRASAHKGCDLMRRAVVCVDCGFRLCCAGAGDGAVVKSPHALLILRVIRRRAFGQSSTIIDGSHLKAVSQSTVSRVVSDAKANLLCARVDFPVCGAHG